MKPDGDSARDSSATNEKRADSEQFRELVDEEITVVLQELLFRKRPPQTHDNQRLRARETARQIVHDRLDEDLSKRDLVFLREMGQQSGPAKVQKAREFLELEESA